MHCATMKQLVGDALGSSASLDDVVGSGVLFIFLFFCLLLPSFSFVLIPRPWNSHRAMAGRTPARRNGEPSTSTRSFWYLVILPGQVSTIYKAVLNVLLYRFLFFYLIYPSHRPGSRFALPGSARPIYIKM